MATATKLVVHLPIPHRFQLQFIDSLAPRIIVRAGRRAGKTTGVAIRMVKRFLSGRRQSYGAPTMEQVDACWFEVCQALREPIEAGVFKKNESEHTIEKVGTQQRIKCRTVWNADTMRGDFGDDIYFDEWQLSDEDAWTVVGAPMLLDNNGTATFIYTPPSLRSAGISKAHDPRHAAKLFQTAQSDTSGRWQAIHFTSHDNPHISQIALAEMLKDMSRQSYRQEIMAEDDEVQQSWLVYRAFNEAYYKIKRFEIPRHWQTYSGHDFGTANPAALFFAQAQLPLPPGAPPYMRLNDLVCFKEYLPGGLTAPQHVLTWREIISEHKMVKSVGGNVTTEEQTRQLYALHGWSIQAPKITHINAQIDRVVGLMELNKVFVFGDCVNYLEEMMSCLWVVGDDGKPTNKVKDEQKYHLCSAARYLLSDFMPEVPLSERKNKIVVVGW